MWGAGECKAAFPIRPLDGLSKKDEPPEPKITVAGRAKAFLTVIKMIQLCKEGVGPRDF